MILKNIISLLANRINQPHVIEYYLRKVYEKGFAEGIKQSPWISVKDRLPQTDDDLYIVLDARMNPPGCGVCDFNPKTETWIDYDYNIIYPTHWMPIPSLESNDNE